LGVSCLLSQPGRGNDLLFHSQKNKNRSESSSITAGPPSV